MFSSAFALLIARGNVGQYTFEKRRFWYDFSKYPNLIGLYIPNYVLYAAIIIGTILLVISFKRSVLVRKAITAKGGLETKQMSKKESKLIRSVITVSLIYIVTCTPLNIQDSISKINRKIILAHINIINFFSTTTELVRSFNHAANIFAYIATNSNFKRHLTIFLCSCYRTGGTIPKEY